MNLVKSFLLDSEVTSALRRRFSSPCSDVNPSEQTKKAKKLSGKQIIATMNSTDEVLCVLRSCSVIPSH